MNNISKRTLAWSVMILLGVLGGSLSLWVVSGDETRRFNRLQESALCVLDLPAETSRVIATFTITRPVERFHIGVQTAESQRPLHVSISSDSNTVASVTVLRSGGFSLGRNIQPGTYTATLRQETKGKGGIVVLSDERPEYVTGSQIWSRTYVGLLILSGICVLLLRKEKQARIHRLSLIAFHSLLLGFAGIFFYLLFHEGGHALAQMSMGRYNFTQSDFWGIAGRPHSGGSLGPPLTPWQQRVISSAGPMLPTISGIVLFLIWSLPKSRRVRSSRPMINLYFSSIVAALVFSEAIAGPAYLLGLITAEGDLIGYFASTNGPVWLVRGFLWGIALASAFILWRVLRELQRAWVIQFLQSPKPTAGFGPT